MDSMTGYGRGAARRDGREITVELKAVNHRFLDVSFRLARPIAFLDDAVRTGIAARLARGHVDVFVNYVNHREDAHRVHVDTQLARTYQQAAGELSDALGVFIPLIVVNCIIIGRAEAFCQKNPVGPSFFDGIFQGLGYTLVLIAMCVIRELLGKGSFGTGIFNTIGGVIGTGNGIQIFPSEYGALVLTLPIGGFITLGCLIALMQYALRKSAEKKEAKEKALAAQEKEAA